MTDYQRRMWQGMTVALAAAALAQELRWISEQLQGARHD